MDMFLQPSTEGAVSLGVRLTLCFARDCAGCCHDSLVGSHFWTFICLLSHDFVTSLFFFAAIVWFMLHLLARANVLDLRVCRPPLWPSNLMVVL